MNGLKTKLIKHYFSTPQNLFSPEELEDGLIFGSMYDIPGIMSSLDGVKLDLRMTNVVEFWTIANNHKMEGLMTQVAQFLSEEPVDKQWPLDLITRILSLHREEIEELKTKQKQNDRAGQKRKRGQTPLARGRMQFKSL